MKDQYRILILGSSDVTFRDQHDSRTLPELIQQELGEHFPGIGWQVDHALLYPTASMAERAELEIDLVQPDAIHLSMGSNTFVEKSVVYAIRRRLPPLFPLARFLTGRTKALAGGRSEGNPGVLGQLFRAPRSLGRMVFGMAPLVDPADALKATIETFQMLATKGVPVVVRLAEGNTQQAGQREAARGLTAGYNEAVTALCQRFGFPAFQLTVELGATYGRTADGLHADATTRAYGASRAADCIAAALITSTNPRATN